MLADSAASFLYRARRAGRHASATYQGCWLGAAEGGIQLDALRRIQIMKLSAKPTQTELSKAPFYNSGMLAYAAIAMARNTL